MIYPVIVKNFQPIYYTAFFRCIIYKSKKGSIFLTDLFIKAMQIYLELLGNKYTH